MKKLTILLVALFFAFVSTGYAQKTEGLKINGQSELLIKADIAVINFNLEGKDLVFDKAVDKLHDKINLLNKVLKKEDIDRSKINASNYQIRKEYNQDYQRGSKEFVGYRASYNISVELPASTKKLNSVFEKLYENFNDLELYMNFGLSNREEYSDELLKLAIKNAGDKANVIAEASGINLGKIKTIEYLNNSSPVRAYSNENGDVALMRKSSVSDVQDFKPGLVKLNSNILVIWNIE